MNVWWIIFGGLAICISHLFMGVLFSITIVGLPFGRQHFKLAGLALVPFGKEIIS
ncbi:MAG: YccF domain-containing protein [Vicingaceae bacterium]|tara:strand:+ start:719 stop:883 length:165 start_codon:yes stop_codon:yes gene_type:complete